MIYKEVTFKDAVEIQARTTRSGSKWVNDQESRVDEEKSCSPSLLSFPELFVRSNFVLKGRGLENYAKDV